MAKKSETSSEIVAPENKAVAQPPMTEAQRVARGRAVDELQKRIADLKRNGKDVPAEWQMNLKIMAESDNYEAVKQVTDWIETELPPQEYMTEEITWHTFAHFSASLLDNITVYAARQQMLGYDHLPAVEILKDILAIRDATESPIIAMNELAKCRKKVLTNLEGFNEVTR